MKFKIFTVTKNEYDIIEDFINYYGTLFGYDNVIIIDNMSTMQCVLDVYSKYIPKGITVYYEAGYQDKSQGKHFTKYMNKHKNECDWLIGLDNDEFIVTSNGDNCSCDNLCDNLSNILGKLDPSIDKVTFDYFCSYCPGNIQQYARPVYEMTRFAYREYAKKNIFRSKNFISTTNGNHRGITTNNKCEKTVKFAALHFHNTGVKRLIEKARAICIAYDYIGLNDSDFEILKKLDLKTTIIGLHRVKQMYCFTSRKYLIDLFVKYIKRLPTETEIETHLDKFKNNINYIDEIDNEFQNCAEYRNNSSTIYTADSSELEILYYNGIAWVCSVIPPKKQTISISCASDYLKTLEK